MQSCRCRAFCFVREGNMDLAKKHLRIFPCVNTEKSTIGVFCATWWLKIQYCQKNDQNGCDEWWPMIRILLLPKPYIRAKCEDTSPWSRTKCARAFALPSFSFENLAPTCMRPPSSPT